MKMGREEKERGKIIKKSKMGVKMETNKFGASKIWREGGKNRKVKG